ncbi:MAG: hypothetical protein PHG68_00480, partial [Candidatus Omnitrophica bacterium]|nr:hypothetical protein [Candidatus Omnitrophota bacterium]
MSIRTKLTLMVLSVALIPILIVTIIIFTKYRNSLYKDTTSYMENIAALKSEKIESYFRELKTNMQVVQMFYVIKKELPILIRFSDDRANPEFVNASQLTDEALHNIPAALNISDIMLVNPEGEVVYSSLPGNLQNELLETLPSTGKKALEQGKQIVSFSGIFLKQKEVARPQMILAAPAFDLENAIIGEIIFEIDMVPAYKVIENATGLGKTG